MADGRLYQATKGRSGWLGWKQIEGGLMFNLKSRVGCFFSFSHSRLLEFGSTQNIYSWRVSSTLPLSAFSCSREHIYSISVLLVFWSSSEPDPLLNLFPDSASQTICSKMKNGTLQSSTMSAVTNQPLPFDRIERERHIQMIFRAFKNRCGPTCECRNPSSKLCNTLDWKADDLRSLAPVKGTENPQLPVSRTELEDLQSRSAGTSGFISMLETVDRIHITARSGLQGESEELSSFHGRKICLCVTEGCCHCRPTVCPQEDLQHKHRRQQLTVNCRRGRY